MTDRKLRVRALLDARFTPIFVLAVLLITTGGWAAWTAHVSPDTVYDERTVTAWKSTGEYRHDATVTEPNTVFPVGTQLENRTTYFSRVAPTVRVTFTHVHTAPEPLDVELRVRFVLRSVDDETVHWSKTRDLGSERVENVAANRPVSQAVTLNTSEVAVRLARIQADLGTTPGETEVFIRTRITLAGEVNNETVSIERHRDLLVSLSEDTYRVEDRNGGSYVVERTERVPVEREYAPTYAVGGPILVTIGLVITGGLLRYRTALELSDAEEAYLRFRDDRGEFDEWITHIRPPEDVSALPRAEASTLADLVNFAIDTDSGVIEDPETGVCYVTHEGTLYTFTPPPTPGRREDD